MKGYTIQHSIDLLEKKVEAGGSGGSTKAEGVSYDNTSSGLTADDVQEAIDELKTDLGTVAASVPTIDNYGVNYSETERVIGKVGDDDLYQKIIPVGPLPNATYKNVAHNISGLKNVYRISGTAYNSTSGLYIPIPGRLSPSTLGATIFVWVDATNVTVSAGSDFSGYTDARIILEYTKTTPASNTRSKKSKKEE